VRDVLTAGYRERPPHLALDAHQRDRSATTLPCFRGWRADDWPLRKWDMARLRKECGENPVSFSARLAPMLNTMASTEREAAGRRLRKVDGASLADITPSGTTGGRFDFKTLAKFLDYVEEDATAHRNPLKDYSHIIDYALPASLKENEVETLCPALYEDLRVPKYMNTEKLDPGIADASHCLHANPNPVIYVAPPHSRAYPTHVHGRAEDNFMFLLQGTKKFVHWPYSAKASLYRSDTTGKTCSPTCEAQGDEIYMCEGIYPDFKRQPELENTLGVALAGEVHAGDLLFIPCGSAHQVENLDITVAVRLTHLDSNTMKCTKNMADQGWGGVPANWVEKYFDMMLGVASKVDDPKDVTLDEFCKPTNNVESRRADEEEDDERDDGDQ